MAELTISRRAITEKELEFFESEVRRWLDVLSLDEWDVEVVADELDEHVLARIDTTWDAKAARVTANSLRRGVYFSEDWLSKTALHEALELLLEDGKSKDGKGEGEPGWRRGVINRLVRALGGSAGKASG